MTVSDASIGLVIDFVHLTYSPGINFQLIGQVVDAIIAPLAPWAAVIPTKYYHTGKILHLKLTRHHAQFLQTPAYTQAINLLDYSVSVVPVTIADKNVDIANPDYEPISELDKVNWELCMNHNISGVRSNGTQANCCMIRQP